jgi:hypothetical protein
LDIAIWKAYDSILHNLAWWQIFAYSLYIEE